ncbi:MAG: preprotein translocase subunit YajC [Reichenbachiella sp.]|uniref:preprotein translocase subunit YajC n=1 Tax=Reichenbachiella sp. TaxID=2184521 RepID=UPI00296689AA|nr:preprotein translocase subunit YajC [Reichenbachiella sp.]MDW3208900.1 preprotein translocase subunit YajC [Reichenbachiella sp.]
MLNFILLQAAGGGNAQSLIMIGVMVVIFYFFFIRPQQKKQKDQKTFSEGVAKGDQVVTIGGIHGKVLSVDESTVTLEIDKGAKMKIEKSSISMENSKKLAS